MVETANRVENLQKHIFNLQKTQTLSIMDLFAGCGGLSKGFELSGFTPIYVNELNDDARATYLLNRNHTFGNQRFSDIKELQSSDIRDLNDDSITYLKSFLGELFENKMSFGSYSDVDVVAGGPPCQGFSGIGHRRSYSVDKKYIPSNKLYQSMIYVIEQVRPKCFLFENVKGLLSSRWTSEGKRGEIWEDVFGTFKKLGEEQGYSVKWDLLKAKDYGAPQNRPRVIIVGIRNDIAEAAQDLLDLKTDSNRALETGFLPKFGHREVPDLIDLLSDLIDPKTVEYLESQDFPRDFGNYKYVKPARSEIQKWFRSEGLAKSGAELTEQEYSRHAKRIVDKFSYMINNNGVIPKEFQTKKFSQRLLPSRWGDSDPFITATSMPDDYVHFSQPRILTVREWARLQTFPDSYKFSGKRTTGGLRRAGNPKAGIYEREVPKYTQIGNAVPVFLAEAISLHLKNIILSAS